MKIYQPLHITYLSQGFYEDNACVNSSGRVVGKRGTKCPAGYSSLYKRVGKKSHGAYDLGAYFKQPTYFNVEAEDEDGAPMTWSVYKRYDNEWTGRGLKIMSDKPCKFHIGYLKEVGKEAEDLWAKQGGKIHTKFTFWHAHRNDIDDRVGSPVEFGERIQLANSTGASSGHHLHFSMSLCDENGRTLDKDNGWLGNVEFTKLYDRTPITKVTGEQDEIDAEQQIDRAIFQLRRITKNFVAAFQLARVKSVLKKFNRI